MIKHKKMSEALMGHPVSQEIRLKISNSLKGRKLCVLNATKKLIILVMCLIVGTGCLKTPPKELKVWWGSKEEIKLFLDRPEAKADKWLIQSIGE